MGRVLTGLRVLYFLCDAVGNIIYILCVKIMIKEWKLMNSTNTNELNIQQDIICAMGIVIDTTKLTSTVEKIKKSDLNTVKNIGSDVQQKISTAVSSITERCRTLNCGVAGEALISLNSATAVNLNASWLEQKLFGATRIYKGFVGKYKKASKNLEDIVERVEGYRLKLENSFGDLSTLVEVSKESFSELEYYVEAFKKCYTEQDELCKTLKPDSLEYLGEQQKLQVYRRRLDTIAASRVVLYQTVKESMLLMMTNRTLIDDMAYTVDNIVPLWQAQIITATNAELQKNAVKINQVVRESFNKMLVDNAKRISDNAVDILNSSTESIISVEALEEVGKQLDGLTARLKDNYTKTTEQYSNSIQRLESLVQENNQTNLLN